MATSQQLVFSYALAVGLKWQNTIFRCCDIGNELLILAILPRNPHPLINLDLIGIGDVRIGGYHLLMKIVTLSWLFTNHRFR